MKAEDLKGKTVDELQKTLMDLKKQQFNLRIQLSQGQLENTGQIRTVRRNIARVKTFIGQQAGGTATVKAAPKKKAEAAKKAPAKKAAAKKTAKKKPAASKAKKTDDGKAA